MRSAKVKKSQNSSPRRRECRTFPEDSRNHPHKGQDAAFSDLIRAPLSSVSRALGYFRLCALSAYAAKRALWPSWSSRPSWLSLLWHSLRSGPRLRALKRLAEERIPSWDGPLQFASPDLRSTGTPNHWNVRVETQSPDAGGSARTRVSPPSGNILAEAPGLWTIAPDGPRTLWAADGRETPFECE